MIAISKQFTSSKIALLQTNYEILRTQIIMNKGTNLYVGPISCRLHIVHDQYSIDELTVIYPGLTEIVWFVVTLKSGWLKIFNAPYIDMEYYECTSVLID